MHSTSKFIQDKCLFSKKNWGHHTAIHVKLVKSFSKSNWANFYLALSFAGDMQEKLKEFSHPVEHWTNNPDEYFLMESDPIEEEQLELY